MYIYTHISLCSTPAKASLLAQLVKNLPAMWETWVDPWVGKIPWKRKRLPIAVFWPGEFHGLYSPWGRKELDMTEQPSLTCSTPETILYIKCTLIRFPLSYFPEIEQKLIKFV